MTTFPNASEQEKAETLLRGNGIIYRLLSAQPGYCKVGTAALVIDECDRTVFGKEGADAIVTSGWVEFREPNHAVPRENPAEFGEDVFGKSTVMILQPCYADHAKLRAIAHLSGDLSEVFPYANALQKNAFYNVNGPTFTFLDQYRMITLYPRRIAVAKVDDIIDVWRILELLRVRFNEYWANRRSIEPSYELRTRPAALDIYFKLPRTNCGQCGEKACMAFALKLREGQISLFNCRPVFEGAYAHLKDALYEICAGLGDLNP